MTVVTHSLDDPEAHALTAEETAAPAYPVEDDFPMETRRDRPPIAAEPLPPDEPPAISAPNEADATVTSVVQEPERPKPAQPDAESLFPGASTPTLPPPSQPEQTYSATIDLAARDVRMVLQEQREQSQTLITKLNILFVANGALLSSLTISRLMTSLSPFTLAEALEFIISFALLVRAFLPRQVAVSPNLEDRKFLERYLALSAEQYQLQMLVNLSETYNANKQRLDDISQTLVYAAYATLCIATTVLLHMLLAYSGWYSTA